MLNSSFSNSQGQDIFLTFDARLFSKDPRHVLVVPTYKGKLLLTCHQIRGWELPGGKVEAGETIYQAAIREAWEETGAKISEPEQVGEYRVTAKGQEPFCKAIMFAKVLHLDKRPEGFETVDSRLFSMPIDPMQTGFSPIMQDQIFVQIQNILKGTQSIHRT